MSADIPGCTWSIECKPLYWMDWAPELTGLSREVAEEQVIPKQQRNPSYLYRLVDDATGEVVHEIRALPHPHPKPDTWQVEALIYGEARSWSVYVDRLDRSVALETAEVIQRIHPWWTLRLQDTSTGEVVHLGRDGKPLPDDVMVPDRRTPGTGHEQEQSR